MHSLLFEYSKASWFVVPPLLYNKKIYICIKKGGFFGEGFNFAPVEKHSEDFKLFDCLAQKCTESRMSFQSGRLVP